ncbi:MAG: hypothetical protein IMZ50_09965 [Candidatus Atribacteria bacterium]|nr:hypothetical protein [Candidatus Atribacteria bacterium]
MPIDTTKLTRDDLELAEALDKYLRRKLWDPPDEGMIEGWVLRFLALRHMGEDTDAD